MLKGPSTTVQIGNWVSITAARWFFVLMGSSAGITPLTFAKEVLGLAVGTLTYPQDREKKL